MFPTLNMNGTQWMLLVMGVLFVALPLAMLLWKLAFRVKCKTAIGKVTRIEETQTEDGNLITPVIEFHTSEGRFVELRPGIGHGLRYLPAVRSDVKIYYLPNSPERAQVASRGLWEVSGIFIIVGCFLIALAVLFGAM